MKNNTPKLLTPAEVANKFTKEWAESHIWEYFKCTPEQILAWGYRNGYEEAREKGNCGKACAYYEPRNGKSGNCKHNSPCYTPTEKELIVRV